MKPIGLVLCLIAVTNIQSGALSQDSGPENIRTALPLLYLLTYPGAVPQIGAPLPGIPIRRPQDEIPVRKPQGDTSASNGNMKLPLSDEAASSQQTNNIVREQFLQGILQGLQQPGPGSISPTISPAVLADFLAQATTSSTRKPSVEKDANGSDNDEDYDYIDFKNGSRIKYDIDEPVNKVLQPTSKPTSSARPASPSTVLYYRRPTNYVYYRPVYAPYRLG